MDDTMTKGPAIGRQPDCHCWRKAIAAPAGGGARLMTTKMTPVL